MVLRAELAQWPRVGDRLHFLSYSSSSGVNDGGLAYRAVNRWKRLLLFMKLENHEFMNP